MDAEYKKLWVDALRSGDYDQTSGVLHNEHGYCCLGVLCEIGVEKGVLIRKNEDDQGSILSLYKWNDDHDCYFVTNLPSPFDGLVGVGSNDSEELVVMNDSNNNSFEGIADWIEENL